MKKEMKFTVIVRILTGLCIWLGITKGYAHFISPYLAEKIPEVWQMILSAMLVPYAVALPVFYLLVRKMDVVKLKENADKKEMSKAMMAQALVIQSGLSFIVMFVVNFLSIAMGSAPAGVTAQQIGSHWLFYIIMLLVFNPIVEELFFRKLILERLRVLGTRQAILVSAIFFALPHVISQGIAQMFYTFVLGLVWGTVTIKSGKLLPAILLHAFSNLYGAFLPLLLTQTVPGTVVFMVIWVILMPTAATILLIRWVRKK